MKLNLDGILDVNSQKQRPVFSVGDKLMAWLGFIPWAFSAIWGTLQDVSVHPNPLPGYRVIFQGLSVAWPVSILFLYILWVVQFKKNHNVGELYFLAGFACCAWLVLMFLVSVGPAMALSYMSIFMIQAARKINGNKPVFM
jgi:hypothetical protein